VLDDVAGVDALVGAAWLGDVEAAGEHATSARLARIATAPSCLDLIDRITAQNLLQHVHLPRCSSSWAGCPGRNVPAPSAAVYFCVRFFGSDAIAVARRRGGAVGCTPPQARGESAADCWSQGATKAR
jgi:hypothetical protein